MNKQNNQDKLQSRRQFFKKTASFVIPMMGIVATGGLGTLLSSCSKEDDPYCNTCSNGCSTQCSNDCSTACGDSCRVNCSRSCHRDCKGGCVGNCSMLVG